MTVSAYQDICSQLEEQCTNTGYDLLQPLCIGWYNEAVAAPYRVRDFGDPRSLAVVIGNTRALWQPFRRAVARDSRLAGARHPLQEYTRRVIDAAVSHLELDCEVHFDFELPPRRVAMQTLAHVAGLAFKSPSGLSVHATYGPWIALRALIVLPVPGPPGAAPSLSPPCDCQHNCTPPLQRALALSNRGSGSADEGIVAQNWQAWVAVRDACPIGRAHRYSDAQIGYHYTKNRQWLDTPDS